MKQPKTTLEQWAAFTTVVEEGSFAKAAEVLNKSQSAVSYTIANLNNQLPTPVLKQKGRKAVLTESGEVLYRRAQQLLRHAAEVEETARYLAQGWETKITLAVEAIVPIDPILQAMRLFSEVAPQTRVTLLETTLSGTEEALIERRVDMIVSPSVPPGFLSMPITEVCMFPVAHPNHPLARIKGEVAEPDLKQSRQIVISDSGLKRTQDKGWLGSEQRFTVSHFATATKALEQGLGFAWLPESFAKDAINKGTLKRINLPHNASRKIPIFLVLASQDHQGPAMSAFVEQLKNSFAL